MPWQHLFISKFGGPEVLEMAAEPIIPEPGPGEVRLKVIAAGTGFTDTMIRLVPIPNGIDPDEAVCIPIAYLTAFQMLTRYCSLPPGATILVIGASGTSARGPCTHRCRRARRQGRAATLACSVRSRDIAEARVDSCLEMRTL
jgi:D-arabinose 1-dehydrogenase-like Zn-dependent alcohol dehydrogenase